MNKADNTMHSPVSGVTQRRQPLTTDTRNPDTSLIEGALSISIPHLAGADFPLNLEVSLHGPSVAFTIPFVGFRF